MTAGAQELRGPRLADRTLEWLEADGLGGFASGTACGERTRRYHGLLLTATTPPTGRVLLVSGLEVQVELAGTAQALSVQRYDGDVVHPDGLARLESFGAHPWPTWRWTLPDGSTVEHELLAPKGDGRVVLCWRRRGGSGPARLRIRPLLCGRDPHALHHENPDFRFDTDASADGAQTWRPYAGLPAVVARSNGLWRQEPQWYRRFLYTAERERGLDAVEDLASPGEWTLELDTGEALLVLGARPEARWRLRADTFERMAGQQARMLAAARRWRAPGGVLVYSVCSFEPEEGEGHGLEPTRSPLVFVEHDPRPAAAPAEG